MATMLSLEQETNPWLAAAARFDDAAMRLKLDDGMRKVLRSPAREMTVNIPVLTGRRADRSLHRLPRAAFDRARSRQGRHPLLRPMSRWMKCARWRPG